MLEDKLLLQRFKNGSSEALCRIYEKYENYLITLATALLGDVNAAEDTVHDIFCSFIENREKIRLKGNLRSYLATCVANHARNKIKVSKRYSTDVTLPESATLNTNEPDQKVIWNENTYKLNCALAQLPFEQRETIVLHLHSGMKFRQIALMQNVSINTIKSQYQYGLKKLRSALNSEMIR
jgi:RNA polymerase sigma-70 factor (ECF subfamily)